MVESGVVAALRSEILNGTLAPGDQLIQSKLAQRFDVSRIPIRDALAQLAAEQLVVLEPQRGAQVIKLNVDQIREIYDLRVLLEVDCLKRSIDVMTDKDLETIDHEAKRCELEAGRPEFPEADWRFHLALYEPSGRQVTINTIRDLRHACRTHHVAYDQLRADPLVWRDQHQTIADACRAKQAEHATNTLAEHLQTAADRLISAMSD